MTHLWPSILCLAAGIACAVGGWRLADRMERKPGEGAVFMRFYSPRMLLMFLGWLMAVVGLIVTFILTPMVYIGSR